MGMCTDSNWVSLRHRAGILLPDDEGESWCVAGFRVEDWLRWKVSRHGDPRTSEEQRDVVGEQLGDLGGEGDGEELAVAVDLVTQEFF